ncbi:nuclear transport factor 2 family protein [Gordonia sp. HNM0687]|uniref:Nuclear transport factor 2 family protein n=1 Tax=Gordonia mangrovi TaxID=2665643 RepID=A0A6L7GX24_9ACTN|nr:nuclear transport factor 2 family protein [Gordonia mangrovi]MXP23581.1 nuclear transport factor 2 family protein [Gordonia mangrovi]UVF79649.1 ester cyclase [Gordonia mangrovi]
MALPDLYRRWIDQLWNGPSDADALAEIANHLVSAGFIGHWPGHDVHGPSELAAMVAEMKEMFERMEISIEVPPMTDGVYVSARWNATGMRSGQRKRFVGNDILRARDGRFVEYWAATVQIQN